MFSFFEGLVDPYGPYEQNDTPARRLWPFLREYIRPFRRVFAITGFLSVVTAFADVALIWYVGRLVDQLANTGPATFFVFEMKTAIVIGAGVTGLSTAYHLAKRGYGRVIVLEKNEIGAGSSSR